MITFEEVELRCAAQISDPSFICIYGDKDKTKREVYAVRGAYNLCPVDGKKLAYPEAIYCGAACAAQDGA